MSTSISPSDFFSKENLNDHFKQSLSNPPRLLNKIFDSQMPRKRFELASLHWILYWIRNLVSNNLCLPTFWKLDFLSRMSAAVPLLLCMWLSQEALRSQESPEKKLFFIPSRLLGTLIEKIWPLFSAPSFFEKRCLFLNKSRKCRNAVFKAVSKVKIFDQLLRLKSWFL